MSDTVPQKKVYTSEEIKQLESGKLKEGFVRRSGCKDVKFLYTPNQNKTTQNE